MKNKRLWMFEIFRGFAAILVSLAVAAVFIFITSDQLEIGRASCRERV